jgi:hypothetical protein
MHVEDNTDPKEAAANGCLALVALLVCAAIWERFMVAGMFVLAYDAASLIAHPT